jgi:prolyl oligopeptidase
MNPYSRLNVFLPMALAAICAIAAIGPARCFAGEVPAPPTPKKSVTNEYHGVKVTDDYQWLEDWNNPDVKAWSEAQNAHARSVLDNFPSVADIRKRITELEASTSTEYGGLVRRAGVLFAMKNQPPKQQPFLVVLKSADDTSGERVIVDPNVIDAKGGTAIDWYVPSPDAKLVAVSMSQGGSESGTVHVFDVATGNETGDVIPRAHGGTAGGSLAWAGGAVWPSPGFFYTRYPRGNERPPEDMDSYQQCYFHKLGTATETDKYVLGKDFPRIAEIELDASEDGKYVLATTQKGDGGEYRLDLICSLPDDLGQPIYTPCHVADLSQRIIRAEFGNDGYLYMLSRDGAPRGKIIRSKLPTLPEWRTDMVNTAETVVPQSDVVIQQILLTKSRFYVAGQIGGISQLQVFDLAGKELKPVDLPPMSSAGALTKLDGDDILYNCQTYLTPAAWYHYDAAKGESRKTALFKTSPADYSQCEVVRESSTSKDGTEIPINIIRKKGTKLDGSNPTIAWGYGGFGSNESPGFSPRRLVFIEQGGVFAIAVIRGGGEFGEDWHQAGYLTKKQNCFDDFYAAAQHLIDAKYCTRDKLAIFGGSNGGLLMGGTFTQHPDLCQAVVSYVGIYDMLRVELSPNGAFNVTEYGTVKDPEQFKALFAYSPYQRVKDGTKYPAVLFTTGANDPRVDPMQSRKMTARLQAANPGGTVLLRTSANAGHGIGSSLKERVELAVDMYAFLFAELGVKYRPVGGGNQ